MAQNTTAADRPAAAADGRSSSATRPDVTAGQVLRRLEKYELLPARDIENLRFELAGREHGDGRGFAERLVAAGRLTRWQAERVVAGRPVVLGQYRLLDRLGAGGMGVVLKARHATSKQIVALKVLSVARLKRGEATQRFFREVEAARVLDHPNIVRTFDSDCLHGSPFLTMEFVPGRNLSEIVRRNGPLPIGWVCEIGRQVAQGLQHAHEAGLVHRDIKPSNLLVEIPPPDAAIEAHPDGHMTVKILDFGMARFTSETSEADALTRTDQVFGTIDFISPEQAHSARLADVRSDLYSLGCTLFYLLTAKPPFPGITALEKLSARVEGHGLSLSELRPETPPGVQKVIRRLLAVDRERRFQKPYEVADALDPFAERPGRVELSKFLTQPAVEQPEPSPSELALEHLLRRASGSRSLGGPVLVKRVARHWPWFVVLAVAAAVVSMAIALAN